MSSENRKKKKKKSTQKQLHTQQVMDYTAEDVFAMMNDTSRLIAEQNSARLSTMGPAATESGALTDSVEFWNWMNRNYSKSGHFASSESMRSYMNGTPGQQGWAKKVVQGKGFEWDWMSAQRKSFKNLFKRFDAGDIANRPGSDITVHDLLNGIDKEYQLKAYTSKNLPHLKNTPKDMPVVTNAEKVESVTGLGYEEVISFGDNDVIQEARESRLEDMRSGRATPSYNIKNVGSTVAKAGIIGFAISVGFEAIASHKKWKEGKLSTWDYLKEIMKSGVNAGITSTFSAGVMIPVTAAITTAGVSSLVTFPVSFVVTATIDKVIAPAFGRGNYLKILNEASYYNSLTAFCSSLASTMDVATTEYVRFINQMASQQQQFRVLAGDVISQQALEDFEYYASLPMEEVGSVISGMVSLLNDTDAKYDNLKTQNWFQRMLKTVTGNNKATKEDIHRNYERLGVYVSKAVEVLYERQCLDEKVLVIYGEQIIALCKNHVSLNGRLEKLESWKRSLDASLLLVKNPDSEMTTVSIKKLVDDATQKRYQEAEALFLAGKLIDALPLFKETAENGAGRAYYYLGEYFINGYAHIKEDESIALEYWRKGMELGEPLSTYEYGLLKYFDDYNQCRNWIKKHIHAVLRLAEKGDPAALCVFGHYLVTDHKGADDLDSILDSLVDSLKYFKEASKQGYWPAAFMYYQATEEIRKSGTQIPNYIYQFVKVEWYKSHFMYGFCEVLFGSNDYDECAHHFQDALWLREDKTESAGFLAFLLNAGLVKDSLAHGYSHANIPMYFEAGLKSEDEMALYYTGWLYFTGIGKDGIKDTNSEDKGRDLSMAFKYLDRCYSLIEKTGGNTPFSLFFKGSAAGALGSMYLTGEGTVEDVQKAVTYLTIGHNLGDWISTYLLATCYKDGLGVKKDSQHANKLMEEFSANPIPEGMERLMYSEFYQE